MAAFTTEMTPARVRLLRARVSRAYGVLGVGSAALIGLAQGGAWLLTSHPGGIVPELCGLSALLVPFGVGLAGLVVAVRGWRAVRAVVPSDGGHADDPWAPPATGGTGAALPGEDAVVHVEDGRIRIARARGPESDDAPVLALRLYPGFARFQLGVAPGLVDLPLDEDIEGQLIEAVGPGVPVTRHRSLPASLLGALVLPVSTEIAAVAVTLAIVGVAVGALLYGLALLRSP